MATVFADNYEEITGKKREDFDDSVGPVSITEMAETKVIDSDSTLVVEKDAPPVETAEVTE